eukprot:8994350-Pyramimonas_sp.AAC.1
MATHTQPGQEAASEDRMHWEARFAAPARAPRAPAPVSQKPLSAMRHWMVRTVLPSGPWTRF